MCLNSQLFCLVIPDVRLARRQRGGRFAKGGTSMAAKMAADRVRPGGRTGLAGAPEFAVRLVATLLAFAVAAVHVADQGGITGFNSPPDWLGWAYRLIEVGGVLTAVVLLLPWLARVGWAAAVLLGTGPFAGYIASRTVGVPGDHPDIGNWGDWVGTVSLIVEAALVVLSVGVLLARRDSSPAASGLEADVVPGRHKGPAGQLPVGANQQFPVPGPGERLGARGSAGGNRS
jgi:hypothetical protein